MSQVSHAALANAIRALAMGAVEKARPGHPGLPMAAAEPDSPDRNLFVLSAGHGSMPRYALLHWAGIFIFGREGAFVCMTGFGAGAPDKKRYEHSGIDAGAVAQTARKGLKGF